MKTLHPPPISPRRCSGGRPTASELGYPSPAPRPGGGPRRYRDAVGMCRDVPQPGGSGAAPSLESCAASGAPVSVCAARPAGEARSRLGREAAGPAPRRRTFQPVRSWASGGTSRWPRLELRRAGPAWRCRSESPAGWWGAVGLVLRTSTPNASPRSFCSEPPLAGDTSPGSCAVTEVHAC